jgi:hypothetical protein
VFEHKEQTLDTEKAALAWRFRALRSKEARMVSAAVHVLYVVATSALGSARNTLAYVQAKTTIVGTREDRSSFVRRPLSVVFD